MSENDNATGEVYKEIALKVLVPALFLIMGGLVNWLNKLDDRQYSLQKEAVTEQKLTETKGELMRYIDVRLNDLDNKMQIVIRQQQELIGVLQRKEQ